MKIYILSFHLKKIDTNRQFLTKWQPHEVRAEPVKYTKNTSFHLRGCPGGAKVEFSPISPSLHETAISSIMEINLADIRVISLSTPF